MLKVFAGIGGAVLGVVMWVVMIVVTSGVCSVPVLRVLWCLGWAPPGRITLWDWFLLLVFVGAGASGAAELVDEQVGDVR